MVLEFDSVIWDAEETFIKVSSPVDINEDLRFCYSSFKLEYFLVKTCISVSS